MTGSGPGRLEIVQMAYLVRPGGLQAGIAHWAGVLGAGPFFVGSFPLEDQWFRGRPTDMRGKVAVGYQGRMQIELIEPTNDAPGPYTEWLHRHDIIPLGGILHHIMFDHDGYDAAVAGLLRGGGKEAFTGRSDMGGRVAYLDVFDTFGCYVEIIDLLPFWRNMCREMQELSSGWDGMRPARSFRELHATTLAIEEKAAMKETG